MHFAKKLENPNHTHVVVAPEYSFWEWEEVGILSWEEEYHLLSGVADQEPWEDRPAHLFFRGNPLAGGEWGACVACGVPRCCPYHVLLSFPCLVLPLVVLLPLVPLVLSHSSAVGVACVTLLSSYLCWADAARAAAYEREVIKESVRKWREAHKVDSSMVAAVNVDFGPERVTMPDHCRHRYLLHIPGVSGSGRCGGRWGRGLLLFPKP